MKSSKSSVKRSSSKWRKKTRKNKKISTSLSRKQNKRRRKKKVKSRSTLLGTKWLGRVLSSWRNSFKRMVAMTPTQVLQAGTTRSSPS